MILIEVFNLGGQWVVKVKLSDRFSGWNKLCWMAQNGSQTLFPTLNFSRIERREKMGLVEVN